MAEFEVLVRRITQPVINHPNADRLTIISIDGFQCIANKFEDGSWRYSVGDLVVYIPEQSVLPEWLLKKNGFWDADRNKGLLHGAAGNRVKAIKLRGIVSQGILYPVHQQEDSAWLETADYPEYVYEVQEGQDVSNALGIIKFEPTLPAHMAGQMGFLYGKTIKYDIENIQRHQTLFWARDHVTVTEKLHGTNVQIGCFTDFVQESLTSIDGLNFYVTSKGLGAKGHILKNIPENDNNVYVKTLRKFLESPAIDFLQSKKNTFKTVQIIGEIIGPGIQDLTYGLKEPELRVFDIMVDGEYLSAIRDFPKFCDALFLDRVPLLYSGYFDTETLLDLRDGKTLIRFGGNQIREGIVIKDSFETKNEHFGRKILKWVSPDYLLRKNPDATEFS